jgi:acetyltransferase-like isoleucine patch superfamily enzyme
MITAVVVLLLGLLPACRAKNVLLCLVGRYSIARSARIHPVIIWHVRSLVVGERGYIGPGNAFRDLLRVELGREAEVGQLNWISGASTHANSTENPLIASLVLEDSSAIVSRHYLDCSGGVRLERLAILGGVRSSVLTHGADTAVWEVHGSPVVIGEATLVFSHALITPGVTIAKHCIIAGGAVIPFDLEEPGRLYGGVPAKVIGDVSDGEHITRRSLRHVPREHAQDLLRQRR